MLVAPDRFRVAFEMVTAGAVLGPRKLQLSLRRHLSNVNTEALQTLCELFGSGTYIYEERRQLKNSSSAGGY